MGADREWPSLGMPRQAKEWHRPEVEHISDDGLTGLCGESLIIDRPVGPTCPACEVKAGRTRYAWPRIGPLALAMLCAIAMTIGQWTADLSDPARVASRIAAVSVVLALAGRTRPDTEGEGTAVAGRRRTPAKAAAETPAGVGISRVDAAAQMFGTGSPQHRAALKRFGPGGGPKTQVVKEQS